MKDSILILTNERDLSVNEVIAILEKNQEKIFRFNTETFPRSYNLSMFLNNYNGTRGEIISSDGLSVDVRSIKTGIVTPESLWRLLVKALNHTRSLYKQKV